MKHDPFHSNRHPVDELGDIRDTLKRLKSREAELRAQLIAAPDLTRGQDFEVTIRTQSRQVFLRDNLPPEILRRPDMWETRRSKVVTLRKSTRSGGAADTPVKEDFAVIEPF